MTPKPTEMTPIDPSLPVIERMNKIDEIAKLRRMKNTKNEMERHAITCRRPRKSEMKSARKRSNAERTSSRTLMALAAS